MNLTKQKRNGQWPTAILTGGAAVLLALLILTGCGRGQNGGAPPPPEVGIITVQAEPVPITTELPGRIDPVRTSEIRARVAGILLKQVYREGSDVKNGDVLFQIDPAPFQAAYDSAKASLAKAEANLKQAQAQADRYEILVKYNAVSKQDYDNATAAALQGNADVLSAKAALETASLNLGYATVTAPISGRIGKALATEGALVGQNEATELAVIQQLDPIYFDFTESSAELLKLRRAFDSGQLKSLAPGEAKVTLLLEDGTVYPHAGKLLFSDVTVDPTTGMVTLRAEFPNPDDLLLPGMFARARLEQAVDNQAITVPQRGVTYGPDGKPAVMALTADNKVEVRPVTISSAAGNNWIVTSGLKAGDRVILEGLQKIQPGMVVTPVPFNATNAPAANASN
ncbi:MAG TPA: efflux RND transporter periplasmic adaptor subunit [Verrucomicrobiae bacterium]|nr:efflux RND transporter periplasmic adaptor subunit [Verrucomicrobiae bacterium]